MSPPDEFLKYKRLVEMQGRWYSAYSITNQDVRWVQVLPLKLILVLAC
jgi:hypothetical protein